MRRAVGAVAAKRGQRRTHCLGIQFVGHRAETIALSAPRQGLLSSQNFVSRPKPYAPQYSKQEQRAITPPYSSRAEEETSYGFGRHDLGSNGFFVVEISAEKQNAHLRPRRRAEQDEPRKQRERRHSRSRPHGWEGRKRGEGGGEKTIGDKRRPRESAPEHSTKLFEALFRRNTPLPLKRLPRKPLTLCSSFASRDVPAPSLARPLRPAPSAAAAELGRRRRPSQWDIAPAATSLEAARKPRSHRLCRRRRRRLLLLRPHRTRRPRPPPSHLHQQPLLPTSTSALRWSRRHGQSSPSAGPRSWTWSTTETSSQSPAQRIIASGGATATLRPSSSSLSRRRTSPGLRPAPQRFFSLCLAQEINTRVVEAVKPQPSP